MAADPTSNIGFQNFFSAQLTSDITATSTDIPLDTVPNVSEGFLVIEPDSPTAREVIYFNSKTSVKVVCPSVADGRGQDDTTAGSHLQGTSVIMAPVAAMFEAIQNGNVFPDGAINPSAIDKFGSIVFDHVISGCVLSGDSYGSTRVASMTSGYVCIGGKVISVSAVTSRTFTASKDTYIDVDNTGAITYTEVANNAASPALAANSIRLGIIITAAGNIADVGSVNQGQENKILPIASSTPYTTTDSLGNLICPRDPRRLRLGYRKITATFNTSANNVDTLITGLTCPVKIPTGRRAEVTVSIYGIAMASGAPNAGSIRLTEGSVGSGTIINAKPFYLSANSAEFNIPNITATSTTDGDLTFNASIIQASAVQKQVLANTTVPAVIEVKLI